MTCQKWELFSHAPSRRIFSITVPAKTKTVVPFDTWDLAKYLLLQLQHMLQYRLLCAYWNNKNSYQFYEPFERLWITNNVGRRTMLICAMLVLLVYQCLDMRIWSFTGHEFLKVPRWKYLHQLKTACIISFLFKACAHRYLSYGPGRNFNLLEGTCRSMEKDLKVSGDRFNPCSDKNAKGLSLLHVFTLFLHDKYFCHFYTCLCPFD